MTNQFLTLLTPANNSGVLGLARTSLDGNVLTVDVAASGLTPGQEHPLHLHGFLGDQPSRLATAADDRDGDGVVETAEGEAVFGPVLAGLTDHGKARYFLETWPGAFPEADEKGNLDFHQSYTLNPNDPAENAILTRLNERLDGRVLELHGVNAPAGLGAGTGGEANGAGGYNTSVPVAQGLVLPGAELPGWLGANSETFLGDASKALSLLAPYSLAPDGSGPLAPEPAGANDRDADQFAGLLLPSNGSGAFGLASVGIDRDAATVTVNIVMAGLEPNQTHGAHIHGFADDRPSLLPNLTLDADKDGFVEDDEGVAVVAPVILALTEDGSITNQELGANFPEADANGIVRLSETYRFNQADPTQAAIFAELDQRLAGREVQFHGLTVPATQGEGTPGEVNGTAGYKEALPVANGILLPVDADLASLVPDDLEGAVAPLLDQYGISTDGLFG